MSNYGDVNIGGLPNKGLLFARIIERLRGVQEDCAMIAHLHNGDGSELDKVMAKGWLGMSELIARIIFQITELAKNKLN